jgi:hypothetical protein
MLWPDDPTLRPPTPEPRIVFIELAIAAVDADDEIFLIDIRDSVDADDESLVIELSLGERRYELSHPDRESATASLLCKLPEDFETLAADSPHELLAQNRSWPGAGFALDEDSAPVFIQTFPLAMNTCEAALLRTIREFSRRPNS